MGLKLEKIYFSVLALIGAALMAVPCIFANAVSNEAVSMFHNGIELYKNGNFGDSAKMFERILDKNVHSGAIYFNLGNAYAKKDELAPARLAYERAKRYIPRDQSLRNNIAYITSRLEDKITLPRPHWWWTAFYVPGSILNHKELSLVLIGSYMLIMMLWALMIFLTSYRGLLKTAMIFACILFLWISAAFCVKIHNEKYSQNAVVMVDEAAVRWGNTENDKVAFFLHAGTKVLIRQVRDNWVLITIGDGKSGWVKKSFLEII